MNLTSSNQQDQDNIKQAFRKSVCASYFNQMGANKYTQQSRVQLEKIGKQQQVDENTFRIMRNFKPAQSNFVAISRQGNVTPQPSGGFFSCFGRKEYHAFLKNSILSIYLNNRLKFYFDFDVINGKVKEKGEKFQVKVQNCDKTFQFYPLHNTSTSDWTGGISEAISNSDGKNCHNAQITKILQFFKNRYISHLQFSKRANTGDIILFRSQHSAARVQQVFMNSQYDHVAVVLRNKKNQLFLYESSSFQGVGLTEWKYMVMYEWYKSAEKMAWKKLNFKLENHHYDIIEAFIAKTFGKQFQITFDKIFSFQSKIYRKKQDQEKKTYFCSQLVARLYKQMGLIDQNVSCTQYYPVTFSDGGNLKFVSSQISLDKEYIIAF